MMRSRMLIGLGITGALVLGSALMAGAQPKESAGSAKPYKPVQSVERMMHSQKKLMGDLKASIGEKAWEEAETAAWLLAESANSNHYQRDDSAYQGFADQMSTKCMALAKSLKKHDEAAAKEGVNSIGQACNACHEQFEKKKKRR